MNDEWSIDRSICASVSLCRTEQQIRIAFPRPVARQKCRNQCGLHTQRSTATRALSRLERRVFGNFTVGACQFLSER
jgi:hypothetical protein